MQFPADAPLAAALAPGQKRYFSVHIVFDWLKNSLYNDPLSDLSANFESASLQRQLSGVVPAELQETEGFSGAQLTVTLSGNVSDGTPIWKVFSPTSGYGIYGSGGAVNTAMALDVITVRADGTRATIRQFTGWVDSSIPSRKDGTVTLICFDGVGQLESSTTVYRWASDSFTREAQFGPGFADGEYAQSGTIEAGWLIDHLFRKNLFLEGPAFPAAAHLAWTLRGSTLPSIGTLAQERPTIYQNAYNFGTGAYNTPVRSPAMNSPSDVWSKAAAKFGVAFKGSAAIGTWAGSARDIDALDGSAQAESQYTVSSFGALNSNILGNGMWVYIDRALGANTLSRTQYFLSDLQLNFSGSNQYPASAYAAVRHDLGIATMTVTGEGSGAPSWTWSSAALATGWHFISWAVEFTPSQVWGNLWVDGVQTITHTTGGHTGGLGALTYVPLAGNTNAATIHVEHPAQFVSWMANPNMAIASYPQPPLGISPDTRYQAKVDLTGQRLHWLPDINQVSSRDVLTAVTGAELGAVYATESGVLTFDSRATIKGRQLAVNVVKTLDLDVLEDIAPSSTYASVANRVGYTAMLMTAVPYSNIYKESQPDQFLVPVSSNIMWPVTLTDVQSYRTGNVTYRPFAQGYDSGLSPPTLYYQNYMDYYKPDYWQDGFTGYVPNSRPSNGPPPVVAGVNVAALAGWGGGDVDCRHMRINTLNTATGSIEYAVDDGTPFLNIAGTIIVARPTVVESIMDSTSIANYKERIYNLPADSWHQDIIWLRSLAASLLLDTKKPQVQFDTMAIPGDPRLQLQDVVQIVDPDLPGAPGTTGSTVAYGSIVGITRDITGSDGSASITDTLTVRTFAP
jgi:hypothetical protein